MSILQKMFGTNSKRELKRIEPIVKKIESYSDEYAKLSDAELRSKTEWFKHRYQEQGESLDDLLPEAFAVCREASRRVLGLYPYRVQLIGGIVLHQGRIAEMKTGEGKTLVATLPAYLNALTGKGVHIVTVNDYLAKRDSEWMGKVYKFLGLSVGLITHNVPPELKKVAYNADITYGTNNEFGFDYLRDNMAIRKENVMQRPFNYAIIDEVDSILIDEARTPLIISGAGDQSTEMYSLADAFVKGLKKEVFATIDMKEEEDKDIDADYVVDEKSKTATLTERGVKKAEQFFGVDNLSDLDNTTLQHHINQALKANGVMKLDIDYVVKNGQVLIVDEYTGRIMDGRRFNEGLHQAIEAKEGVEIQKESKTFASITFQNYFKLYQKMSGMTGTAMTEEDEFHSTYNLDIVEIPTNKPVIRIDHPDEVYKTEAGKLRAVVRQIEMCHEKGQPVLVGTTSVEKSEALSRILREQGIKHNVLNAKNHEQEARIVAQAGKFGAVTVSTNMAGRGTDIMLGGNAEFLAITELRESGMDEELVLEATGYSDTNDESILAARALYAKTHEKYKEQIQPETEKVLAAGGLYIIGTERHEARRIDNQLRGRSGRQGDPGESKFFISLDDDLMRLFGAERFKKMMETLKIDEDTPIDTKMLSNAIENAQKQIESKHFQARKDTLEYDDVMNVQRNVIYEERRRVLNGEDTRESVRDMIKAWIGNMVSDCYDAEGLFNNSVFEKSKGLMDLVFLNQMEQTDKAECNEIRARLNDISPEDFVPYMTEKALAFYDKKEEAIGSADLRNVEQFVILQTVDEYWMSQIDAMSELQKSVRLRGYANEKPVDVYKKEGYEMFNQMIKEIQNGVATKIMSVQKVVR